MKLGRDYWHLTHLLTPGTDVAGRARLSKATGKGEMGFQVQPDMRIKKAPVLLSVSLCFTAACFHTTRLTVRTFSTCTHTASFFLWGGLFSLCPEAAQAHPGLLPMIFPKQFSSTSSGLRAGRFLYREGSDRFLSQETVNTMKLLPL